MHELSPEEISGLPAELLAQLSCRAYPHPVRAAIEATIGERGANVDDVLIGVFRQTKKILSRNAAMGHLYRMQQDGVIVGNGEGFYTMRPTRGAGHVSQNREALAIKIVEVSKSMADGYRRNISQFSTVAENDVSEKCACAASNTGFFILQALGFSNDDIKRFAGNHG